jgi:hypothetical protein
LKLKNEKALGGQQLSGHPHVKADKLSMATAGFDILTNLT